MAGAEMGAAQLLVAHAFPVSFDGVLSTFYWLRVTPIECVGCLAQLKR